VSDLNSSSSDQNIVLSFIIPTLNEEKNIGRLIDSIKKYTNDYSSLITIVDNGSTDSTCDIARQKGAMVLSEPDANIATLRNRGAKVSQGSIYIFLDGDVELTHEWSEEFPNTANLLIDNHNIITGSKCYTPDDASYLEKYWFRSSDEHPKKYINSAHLIIHKSLFDDLNGFNEELITGEDTDLSLRAVEQFGANIINNEKLKALHHGFPKSLYTFIKREAWHGTRTNKLFDVVCCSNIQFATNCYFSLHLLLLISLFTQSGLLAIVSVLLLIALIILSSAYKYAPNIKLIAINSIIFYFYYLGRSMSIINVFIKKITKSY
jgi:glycosyltransferase involved in cell wall biosynthesis